MDNQGMDLRREKQTPIVLGFAGPFVGPLSTIPTIVFQVTDQDAAAPGAQRPASLHELRVEVGQLLLFGLSCLLWMLTWGPEAWRSQRRSKPSARSSERERGIWEMGAFGDVLFFFKLGTHVGVVSFRGPPVL